MIGGEYYHSIQKVADSLGSRIGLLFPYLNYFSTGRDAIFASFYDKKIKRVWLPDYLCHSIWSAVQQTQLEICFYSVTRSLTNELSWVDQVQANDSVFIIHYFGIPQLELLDALQDKCNWIVSDCSHLLFDWKSLEKVALKSHLCLGSLRKNGPFPDGAFCASKNSEMPKPKLGTRMDFWVPRAAALASRSYSAMDNFKSDENFELFVQAEKYLDSQKADLYSMSDLSYGILQNMDWDLSIKRTDENFQTLKNCLGGFFIPSQMPAFYYGPAQHFPILLPTQQRDLLRKSLMQHRIYCPIHWDTSFLSKPNEISDEILSVPCDGRYTSSQMKELSALIKDVL